MQTAPAQQMRLERMGAFFPTRLSFMRILLRGLQAGSACLRRHSWEMDENGYGHAVYTLEVGGYTYSLVAFSNALDDSRRSDRVIANAWDSSYALYDGIPDAAEVRRLSGCVPQQESARYRASELVLSRANKSVRFFEHTVERLAAGRQPDAALVTSVGYLMRTTAVYGNGKFGIADRAVIAKRPLLQPPFQAELLTVWLIRDFTFDLVEHIARRRAPKSAVPLAAENKRYLGIGNSTGLGMAPFLVNHPLLLHQWMETRNQALQVALQQTLGSRRLRLQQLLARAVRHVEQWSVADVRQQQRIVALRRELAELAAQATNSWLMQEDVCLRLYEWSQGYSLECQELIIALLLEITPEVNELAGNLSNEENDVFQPAMTVRQLQTIVQENFAWALAIDYEQQSQSHHFWYVSAEKLEPRLGARYCEQGSEKELPLDIARRIKALSAALADAPGGQLIAEFLLDKPQLRYAVRRVQTQSAHCYAEIQENLIAAQCQPVDMLRFKLAFFGACKFDPKSALWTRISLFQGAPRRETLLADDVDDWWLPVYEGEGNAPLRQ